MTTETHTLTAILRHLRSMIGDAMSTRHDAMRSLERIGISREDYMIESASLMHSSFIIEFLTRVRLVASRGDLTETENFIRFHLYQLSTKGIIGTTDPLSRAQHSVARLLNIILTQDIEMTRQEVMAQATPENPVVNSAGNKIEFQDGTCYAMTLPSGKFQKVKVFTL